MFLSLTVCRILRRVEFHRVWRFRIAVNDIETCGVKGRPFRTKVEIKGNGANRWNMDVVCIQSSVSGVFDVAGVLPRRDSDDKERACPRFDMPRQSIWTCPPKMQLSRWQQLPSLYIPHRSSHRTIVRMRGKCGQRKAKHNKEYWSRYQGNLRLYESVSCLTVFRCIRNNRLSSSRVRVSSSPQASTKHAIHSATFLVPFSGAKLTFAPVEPVSRIYST